MGVDNVGSSVGEDTADPPEESWCQSGSLAERVDRQTERLEFGCKVSWPLKAEDFGSLAGRNSGSNKVRDDPLKSAAVEREYNVEDSRNCTFRSQGNHRETPEYAVDRSIILPWTSRIALSRTHHDSREYGWSAMRAQAGSRAAPGRP